MQGSDAAEEIHRPDGDGTTAKAGGLSPYFEGEGVTLYHGDCLDILRRLPAAQFAACVTDPPYSSGGMGAAERHANPRDKYCQHGHDCGRPTFNGDNRDQRSFRYWSTLWLSEALRVCQESAYLLLFTDWRQLPTTSDAMQAGGWIWRGTVAWDKGRGARMPHKGFFRHQCEYILWGTHGRCRKRSDAAPLDGCFRESVKQSDKFHMTGKPTPLLRELVRCVDPGETILDPFAGSGTTGVAALQEGRKFVGIEQSEAYCEIAARRLEGT